MQLVSDAMSSDEDVKAMNRRTYREYRRRKDREDREAASAKKNPVQWWRVWVWWRADCGRRC